jgi:3-hydroxyisobutyrate dehydrogenase-like beta-hydroxyacid dehydrogenase
VSGREEPGSARPGKKEIEMRSAVGVIGLGNMGGAIARNLLDAGFDVVGLDVDPARVEPFTRLGGKSATTPAQVTEQADIVILSLPNVAALEDVVHGLGGLAAEGRSGVICVETSTFPISAKTAAADALAARDIALLDCTVSGTGSQARERDIVLYTSGPPDLLERCRPVFEAVSKASPRVGDFGAGSIMKFVSNLLVAVHTVAAAEALTLAAKAGLDTEEALELISAGAGNSRMLEVRGPLMVAGDYDVGSATLDTLTKDSEIILGFASEQDCPTPLLSIAATFLRAAAGQGLNDLDPAVVREVLGALAGLPTSVDNKRSVQ